MPTSSDEVVPLNVQVSPGQLQVKRATGDAFGGASAKLAYSKRFGEPVPAFVILFTVAAAVSALATAAGWVAGLSCRYRATAPATCGDAMDVPLSTAICVSPVPYED